MKLKNYIFTFLLLCSSLTLFAENKAANFTGNGRIEIPHFTIPSNITLEAWIKTTQTNTGTILSWKDMDGDGAASLFRVFNGNLQFGEWFSPSWKAAQTSIKINTGTWTHVAVVRYKEKVFFYINGEKAGNSTLHETPVCSTTHLQIGSVGTLENERFKGQIDEVRIWNIGRTSEQIKKNYKKELVGDEIGLESYWQFNDDFIDKTSKHRNGTAENTTFILSDLFNSITPEITTLSFNESSTEKTNLTISAKTNGTVYWGITTDQTTTITKEMLEKGDPLFENNGEHFYTKYGENQKLLISTTLTIDKSYKVYAVLKNEHEEYSKIVTSKEFIYKGLKPLPQDWDYTDIGQVGILGKSFFKDNCFHIIGSGSDIWNSNDAFHFAYKKASKNIEITAHVKEFTNTSEWNKIGVMIRQSLNPNSVTQLSAVTSENGVGSFSRSTTNAFMTYKGNDKSNHHWLKVIYLDEQLAAFSSADGTAWIKRGKTIFCEFSEEFYIGLATCSHDNNKLCEAQFDTVKFAIPSTNLNLRDKPDDAANLDWENEIPQIIHPNKELVQLYNETWAIASDRVRIGPKGLPSSPYLDENCYEDQIWIWDACYMVLFSKYAPKAYPGKETLNNLYLPIHENRPTPLLIHLTDNPPLFSWAEYDNFQFSGDQKRLDSILIQKQFLQRHFNYFNTIEKGNRVSYSPNPINRGVVKENKRIIGFTWTGGASGMDNTPRGRDQGGQNNILWIDAISQQALSALYITRLYKEKNLNTEVNFWQARYDSLKNLINEKYWNEKTGFYCDVNKTTGTYSDIKTPASFWPMMAEVASKEQANKMISYLRNSDYLGGNYPWPSLSRDDKEYENKTGNYWKGGIWLPLVYMGTKALEKYGYYNLADSLAEKVVMQQLRTYQKITPHTIWECYSPSCDEPSIEYNHRVRPDFCGWSALGPISLTIENILGFRKVNATDKSVEWWLKKKNGYHGIQKLSFGNITTNIIYDPQTNTIDVKTNNSYTLILNLEDQSKYKLLIKKGKQQFDLTQITSLNKLETTTKQTKNQIYNLSGCKQQKTKKGVFIVNGEKILVK